VLPKRQSANGTRATSQPGCQHAPCLVGTEACVGAHHLSRKLKAPGHDARLMPAKYVRPYSVGSERKMSLESQARELEQQIRKLSEAHASLQFLTRDHPLHAAMQAALEQNRAAIEAIFMRIHSPEEFSGLGRTFSTLQRKFGGRAELTEVSTGQRAAFALSIFLAQNAQLVGAPPVILIDDPIAHIDDLNSLSFLDYLRDIAIEGRRQIFFATANEKIATLFERKFDFL